MKDRYLFKGIDIRYNITNGHCENVWRVGHIEECKNGDLVINTHKEASGYGGLQYQVEPQTVGQCTGRKDQQGNLMFEGDVGEHIDDDESQYRILWNERKCCFMIRELPTNPDYSGYEWGLGEFDLSKFYKVIGNIYNNPELKEK